MNEIEKFELAGATGLVYHPGTATLNNYEELKAKAEAVAAYVDSVELTDDNVQECKKLLSRARSVVNCLDDRRKEIKKAMLEPYNAVADQINEISGIVTEAENRLRSEVKDMETNERNAKAAKIEDMFLRAAESYEWYSTMDQDKLKEQLIKPEWSNKSTALSAITAGIVGGLTRVNSDLIAISRMTNSKEIGIEYRQCLDMDVAIATAESKIKIAEKMKNVTDAAEVESEEETMTVRVTGHDNVTIFCSALVRLGIEYEVLE